MKVVLVFGLAVVTLVRAQYEDNYPTHYGHQKLEHEIEEDHKDYHDEPNYKYEYKVDDHHTGDFKGQAETREGDTVKGYYMIKEADGTLREVHYTADSHNGFNAVVKRTGTPTEAPEHEVKKFHPKFYSSHDFDASEHHNQFAYPEQPERRVFKKKPTIVNNTTKRKKKKLIIRE